MQKRCLIDVDCVVADLISHACKHHEHDNVFDDVSKRGTHNVHELLGLTNEQYWDTLDYDFWSTIPKLDHADRLINLVESLVGLKNMCFLTSPTRNDVCSAGKHKWIKINYPRMQRRFLIGPAKNFCANPRHVLIDDSEKHIKDFIREGGIGYLFPYHTNGRHTEYGESHVWVEIANLLRT